MLTETVEYQAGDWEIRTVGSEATVRMGARRTRLMIESREHEKEDGDDLDLRLLRLFVYPVCIAGTAEAEGIPWPLEFQNAEAEMDFVRLPDQFVMAWEAAVTRLNPHWKPQARSKKD